MLRSQMRFRRAGSLQHAGESPQQCRAPLQLDPAAPLRARLQVVREISSVQHLHGGHARPRRVLAVHGILLDGLVHVPDEINHGLERVVVSAAFVLLVRHQRRPAPGRGDGCGRGAESVRRLAWMPGAARSPAGTWLRAAHLGKLYEDPNLTSSASSETSSRRPLHANSRSSWSGSIPATDGPGRRRRAPPRPPRGAAALQPRDVRE